MASEHRAAPSAAPFRADTPGSLIEALPIEVRFRVLSLLDDPSFCAARTAHRCFCLHDRDEIQRHRRIPRWLRSTSRDLCRAGNVEAVRFLSGYPHRRIFTRDDLSTAIKADRVPLVRLLGKMDLAYTFTGHDFLDEAAEHASLKMLLVVSHMRLGNFSRSTMNYAARGGRLDTVQWLHHSRSEGCNKGAMDFAAACGHMHVLKFLHENRDEGCSKDAIGYAAANGHLDAIIYVHAHRNAPCPTRAIEAAAHNGRLDIVRFLCENYPDVARRVSIMWRAAIQGHLDIVRYGHEQQRREVVPTYAMDQAAAAGHLDVVIYLDKHRTEGCTTAAMDGAAANGHLHVVQWLHEHRREGCTHEAMNGAARSNNVAMVRWLYENRLDQSRPLDAVKKAAKVGAVESALYLAPKIWPQVEWPAP